MDLQRFLCFTLSRRFCLLLHLSFHQCRAQALVQLSVSDVVEFSRQVRYHTLQNIQTMLHSLVSMDLTRP